jgi:hypothetical protein
MMSRGSVGMKGGQGWRSMAIELFISFAKLLQVERNTK